MKDLGKTFLFRMTHIENIPHILQHGIVRLSSATADPGFVPIGDSRVIDVRKNFLLKNGQTLGEYIPFYFGPRMPMLYVIQIYFGPRMPMLYVIQNGFNSVPKLSAEKIVYCLSSVQKIEDQKLDYIFTDGHALSILTTYYDRRDIAKINELVDWEAVRVKYWTNDSDLKRRKEAEVT